MHERPRLPNRGLHRGSPVQGATQPVPPRTSFCVERSSVRSDMLPRSNGSGISPRPSPGDQGASYFTYFHINMKLASERQFYKQCVTGSDHDAQAASGRQFLAILDAVGARSGSQTAPFGDSGRGRAGSRRRDRGSSGAFPAEWASKRHVLAPKVAFSPASEAGTNPLTCVEAKSYVPPTKSLHPAV